MTNYVQRDIQYYMNKPCCMKTSIKNRMGVTE